MIIQTVTPENGGQEGKWIALLCLLILLIGAILLPYNQANHQQAAVNEHQIFIKSLPAQSLTMIADLRLAHEEIRHIYQNSQSWPPVTQLADNWVAPFVKDKSWEHQGKHQWRLIAEGIYQGVPVDNGARYLLNSQQSEVDIWLDLKGETTPLTSPDSFQIPQLIEAGWTQVTFEAKHAH